MLSVSLEKALESAANYYKILKTSMSIIWREGKQTTEEKLTTP